MKWLTYGPRRLSSVGNSFSQYVKNLAMMNVIAMEKGKERWGMIADDIWDMLLGKLANCRVRWLPKSLRKPNVKAVSSLPETHRIIIRMRSISIAR